VGNLRLSTPNKGEDVENHGRELQEIATYLANFLRLAEVPDYPPALNGVQVENSGRVTRIAAAVDAAQATIEAAARSGADLLLVHHGLFWDGNKPVTGRRFRRLQAILRHDMAVYAAHLPLDVHPEVGNNACLARALGMEVDGTFGSYNGWPLGLRGRLDIRREALAARLDELLGGPVRLVPGGAERIRTVGIISGGAGGQVGAAREAGLDAFITGEGAHHNYFDAAEGGINLYLGGHYATETWGVKALAEHLAERFGLPWSFIPHPTGL
jgi:dinuclear metal center YbgI/SA1388 family protein